MAKPNVTWPQFAVCNDNATREFEGMCRRIFRKEFAGGQLLHTNHNTPGIEVLPVSEPGIGKQISFQSKYFDQSSTDYAQIKKSAKETVKHFKDKLDLVYLFCNKTVTTTSEGYRDAEKILNDAGIELIPISNEDLLDLVRDYTDIAEYYFTPRTVADTSVSALKGVRKDSSEQIIITAAAFSSTDSEELSTNQLLKDLIEEKIQKCRTQAVRFELNDLQTAVEKLFSYGSENDNALPETEELYFYRLLICLYNNDESAAEEYLPKCGKKFKDEAQWIINYYRQPFILTEKEFVKHTPVIQIFAIDKLLIAGTSEKWEELVKLYPEVRQEADPSTYYQLDLHYGLSLLNLRRYNEASKTLHGLYDDTKEDRMLFFATFADISIQNIIYQSGRQGDDEKLGSLLKLLRSFKDLKQYRQQEVFVAGLIMESSYHLGLSDKAYLEDAIEEYDSCSEEVKNKDVIRYFYGLCLELNGERSKAVPIYADLPWKTDPLFTERYMLSLILTEKPAEAIKIYEEAGVTQANITPSEEAAYLFALDRSGDKHYTDELQKVVGQHNNLFELFECVNYVDTTKAETKNIVIPALKALLNEESIAGLKFYQKIEITTFLAHSGEILIMEDILDTIEDLSDVNSFAAGEIYKALFSVANKEYSAQEKSNLVSDELEAADRMAKRFLDADVSKKKFLQIEVLCSGAKQLPYSSLKYTKELYDITHDIQLARSIVALLVDRKIKEPDEYRPYLDVIEDSEVPDYCMVAAFANLLLGYEERADYYAYKALYLLNGKDNFDIFKTFFSFANYNLRGLTGDLNLKSVRGNVVVTLRNEHAIEGEKGIAICLDSEREFHDVDNHSMGIRHLNPSEKEYIKIYGSGLKQILNLSGMRYQIIDIMPREKFALRYIFQKVQENPDMFKGVVWMINTTDADEMIKRIRELTDNSDRIKTILDFYHFENNDFGLPIDALSLRDYTRYIDAMAYLLYRDGEAFFAGQPVNEDESGQKYVPDISTLTFLAIIDRLDILEPFRDEELLIIPESYDSFFNDQYTKARVSGMLSVGNISFVDGKALLTPVDKKIPEIWEAIVSFCDRCSKRKIDNEERVQCQIVDGLSGERLITGLGLDFVHLDALILAQRENGTLISDDLFFRKVATNIRVRNLNSASLIQHYKDFNFVCDFVMELSKSNYVYVPLLARNDKEAHEFTHNLLSGDRKKHYYGELLQRYVEIKKQIYQQIFGTDSKSEEGIL